MHRQKEKKSDQAENRHILLGDPKSITWQDSKVKKNVIQSEDEESSRCLGEKKNFSGRSPRNEGGTSFERFGGGKGTEDVGKRRARAEKTRSKSAENHGQV